MFSPDESSEMKSFKNETCSNDESSGLFNGDEDNPLFDSAGHSIAYNRMRDYLRETTFVNPYLCVRDDISLIWQKDIETLKVGEFNLITSSHAEPISLEMLRDYFWIISTVKKYHPYTCFIKFRDPNGNMNPHFTIRMRMDRICEYRSYNVFFEVFET